MNKLDKAIADYEKASADFLKCRCYSYYQMVLITSQRLLEASDDAIEVEQNRGTP